MLRLAVFLVLLLPAFPGGTPALAADWSAPKAVSPETADAHLRFNWGKSIAVDAAGGLHITWVYVSQRFFEDGVAFPDPVVGQVFYQRLLPGQSEWSFPVAMTPPIVGISHPKIAAASENVYVIWSDSSDWSAGAPYVYLRASADRGESFEQTVRVSETPGHLPAVAAWGDHVHLVWSAGEPAEVFMRSSTDGGTQWGPVRMPSTADPSGTVGLSDGFTSWTPMVAAEGNDLYVAWTDERHNRDDVSGAPYDCGLEAALPSRPWDSCREEIYFRHSPDLGATWGQEYRVTHSAPVVGHNAASLDVNSGVAHLTYQQKPAPGNDNHYARCIAGLGCDRDKPIMADPNVTFLRPTVAARASRVEIVGYGIRTSGAAAISEIYYAESNDWGASFSPIERIPGGHADASQPHLIFDAAGTSHLIYTDNTETGETNQIYYSTK